MAFRPCLQTFRKCDPEFLAHLHDGVQPVHVLLLPEPQAQCTLQMLDAACIPGYPFSFLLKSTFGAASLAARDSEKCHGPRSISRRKFWRLENYFVRFGFYFQVLPRLILRFWRILISLKALSRAVHVLICGIAVFLLQR